MNDYDKRAFIAASGQVLTDILPDDYDDEDWEGENGEGIDEWLINHAWEPFDYWSAEQLWKQINELAYSMKSFHEREVKLNNNN